MMWQACASTREERKICVSDVKKEYGMMVLEHDEANGSRSGEVAGQWSSDDK